MDTIDAKLLSLLVERARTSESELLASLGLSASDLSERLARLEKGAGAAGAEPRPGDAVEAFVTLRLGQASDRGALAQWASRTAEVSECHHVTGEGDYVMKIRCRDVPSLDALLSSLPGGRARTRIVLSTLKAAPAAAASDAQARKAPPPPPAPSSRAERTMAPPPPPSGTQRAAPTAIGAEARSLTLTTDFLASGERFDEAALVAPEPPAARGPRRSRIGGRRKGMPMTNNEKTIVKALVAVLWADGRVEKSELALIDDILIGFEASPAEREALRNYALVPRSLDDEGIVFDLFSGEERELLLTNAALMAQADGRQSPSERRVLLELSRRLGYNEQQASIILDAAVEEGALSLPSHVLEEAT